MGLNFKIGRNKIVKIGDIYWAKTEGEIEHPHVIILVDESSVTVCAITTNQNKASMPGNVMLETGEGNLEKLSIVEVAKEYSIDKTELKDYIGQLSDKRVEEILKGIQFIKRSFLPADRIKPDPTSPQL